MADQTTATGAPFTTPLYDQYISFNCTAEMRDFLDGVVQQQDGALKRADLIRQLIERGIEATIKTMGPAGQRWYADAVSAGRAARGA